MDCTGARERLRERVRGGLDPETTAGVDAHLAGCADCRHEAEAERLLDAALRGHLAEERAPDSLRRRVAAVVRADGAPVGPGRPERRPAWAMAAAALVLALLGFLGGRAAERRSAAEALADELVSDHLRVLASAHPLDVESTDSHQVKPWFEGRLDFAPVVPGDRGELRLAGGSVGYVMDRKAAVLAYALRSHRLTLLAFPRDGTPGLSAQPGAAPSRRARRGFEVVTWSAGDVAYALVGDVSGAELERIAVDLAAQTRR